MLKLFAKAWVIYTLLFALLVGGIIRLLEASGAVRGFVHLLTQERSWVASRKSALFLGYFASFFFFVESSIASLLVATITKPFAYTYRITREKIAYLCDTASAPVCSLVALNGWGALILGIITATLESIDTPQAPIALLLSSLAFNFYAIVALLFLGYIILRDRDFATMQTTQTLYEAPTLSTYSTTPSALYFFLPLATMVGTLLGMLLWTGDGSMLHGSGSLSVLVAVSGTLGLMAILYISQKLLSIREWVKETALGVRDMVGIVLILVGAFLLSDTLSTLGTARFLGEIFTASIPLFAVPALLFVLASVIAFATGTSWGTFAIMIPIAMYSITPESLPYGLVIGAVISGGVFGDHASPISDTTIIASMASQCPPMNHVKTQLPYALTSAFIALGFFLVAGLLSAYL
ncbi:MAG: hypothetical protein KU37_04440 [Sulfuricurvum sp. PC08-66]|nr:MAG: hypothetical protein KU37_04440 [Sulfuricurvum sp. PC08-66]